LLSAGGTQYMLGLCPRTVQSASVARSSIISSSRRKPGRVVVLNRWPRGKLCASCFDVEAEKAKVRFSFVNVTAISWSDQPPPRNPYKRKR
jgi:hypothetical protein